MARLRGVFPVFSVSLILGSIVQTFAVGQEDLDSKPGRSRNPDADHRVAAAVVLKPTVQQEDATLRSLSFVGERYGYAAGDSGCLLKTADGGDSWSLIATPTRANLHSVCFLTDRVGWIAGVECKPFTRRVSGVVYFTRDGGQTWENLSGPSLPGISHIQFFDLEHGVAVGTSNDSFPTGVFSTEDGGRHWQEVPGPPQSGWRAARFLNPEIGVVAGRRGKLSVVGEGRLLKPRIDSVGQRTLHGLVMEKEQGWLVGDGALVMHSTNGGVVWKEPAQPLPEELRDYTDFYAVAARGKNVWMTGSPGSAVWHSADGGNSWRSQRTPGTAPLFAIQFLTHEEGIAVGAFGAILRTTDGGSRWTAVRGSDRRAAMLNLNAWPGRIPFEVLAKQSAELGHRAVVMAPLRQDMGFDAEDFFDFDLQLDAAVTRSGGSRGEVGWRFPLAIPGLEKNADRLMEDWNRRTEGRLGEVFLGSLIGLIRTWRPNVIVLDQPAADDVASQILNDGVVRAVQQAADATRQLPQQTLSGLEPWSVDRVFVRLPPGSQGEVHVEPFEYLPRNRRTIHDLATPSLRLAAPTARGSSSRIAFRQLKRNETEEVIATRDFFTGLALGVDADARRRVTAIDGDGVREQELAERQRNFHAYVEKFTEDPRLGSQLISQLRDVTQGMGDEQAAMQLAALARNYQRHSRYDLAEATFVELIERFPDEPASMEGMVWLFHRWSAAEPAWQRARATRADMQRLQSNPDRVAERIAKVSAQLAAGEHSKERFTPLTGAPDPLEFTRTEGQPQIAPGQHWRTGAVQHWLEQAVRMASLIRSKDGALYQTQEIQFPLAALMRQRGVDRFADSVYRRQQQSTETNPWREVAETELWLTQPISQSPRPFHKCYQTVVRPVLDGVLSDDCWASAVEMRLNPPDETEGADFAFVLLAHDAEYLYFAGSFPRRPGVSEDRPRKGGRTHDADLSQHDRVSLYLDLDRDYATWYTFEIDQRGMTAERCWDDASWNPKWFVAADADDSHWRFEAAIPFAELTATPPGRNQVWAAGVTRTIPAVGVESWTKPVSSRPRPERFGLLKFDADR